ncbi:MAG: peptidylprolyl isomerase [Ilumatobacteraceae bacterium]
MGTDKRSRKKENRQKRLSELARANKRRRTQRNVVRIFIVLAIVVSVAGIFSVTGGNQTADAPTTTEAAPVTTNSIAPLEGRTVTGDTPCPATDGSEERAAQFEKAPPTCIEDGVTYTALISTNKGDFTIQLDQTKAPLAVNSFVTLARYKYFDGTQCHRAIPNFVVQCGDPTATGSGGPGYQFADELPAQGEYKVGSIAMANSGPNTNGSQFFVITGEDGASLPPQYTLFGQVTKGLETTVPALDAAGNPESNGVPPLEPIVINSVTIVEG